MLKTMNFGENLTDDEEGSRGMFWVNKLLS